MKKTAKKPRLDAQAWMVRNGLRQTDIKVSLGHKSINQVHGTLQGDRNDRRVLQYLLDKGCPPNFLDLPADMAA